MMPPDREAELYYDSKNNVLYASHSGSFTVEDFERTLSRIVSSNEFPPNVSTLWDLTSVNLDNFDWTVINDLIAVREKFPEREDAKIAVVSSDDLNFGLFRMYASRSDNLPQSIRTFRDRASAESWLLDQVS